jgi:pyrroline-5-carboxylate reductase
MDAATVAFVGGGNMAGALLGGLLGRGRERPVPRVQGGALGGDGRRGADAAPARDAEAPSILVVEPSAERRAALARDMGVTALAEADASLARAAVVVWAVKPQAFHAAAAPCAAHVAGALHVSVMAGIPCSTIAAATGSRRIVRAMPNTPALIGEGIAGVYATRDVGPADRALADRLLAPTGERVWFEEEATLDAVTALSGSGPAYVFLLLEAMTEAGLGVGLAEDASRRLALQTLAGAARLAQRSDHSAAELRRQVTSPGGTTEAALRVLEARGVREAVVDAVRAARDRAHALGAPPPVQENPPA